MKSFKFKIVIWILVSFISVNLISGCSSNSKKTDEKTKASEESLDLELDSLDNKSGGKSSDQDSKETAAKKNEVIKTQQPVKVEVPKVEPPKIEGPKIDPLYQPIVDGLRTQNDDLIRSTALNILSQNPNDIKALNALAYYYTNRKQFGVARLVYSKAIKLDPTNSALVNNLAVLDLNAKEEQDALRGFRRALEINPNDTNAAVNLGTMYVVKKDFSRSLYGLEMSYQKGQRTLASLNNYAVALVANGKPQMAKPIYEEALALQSSSKEVMFNYVVLLVDHLNMNKEAMDYINKLNALGVPAESRNRWNNLENKARTGLK